MLVAFVVAMVTLTAGGSAVATSVVLYDNVATDGAWTAAGGVLLAQTFETGADDVTLDSVQIRFRNANEANSFSASSSFTLAVYPAAGGVQVGVPTASVGSTSAGAWSDESPTYVLAGPVILQALTRRA